MRFNYELIDQKWIQKYNLEAWAKSYPIANMREWSADESHSDFLLFIQNIRPDDDPSGGATYLFHWRERWYEIYIKTANATADYENKRAEVDEVFVGADEVQLGRSSSLPRGVQMPLSSEVRSAFFSDLVEALRGLNQILPRTQAWDIKKNYVNFN